MKKITITIKTENAAFADGPKIEVARILRELADRIESHEERDWPEFTMDYNGNRVGKVVVE